MRGPLLLKTILKRIELAKIQLMIDIETGKEVYVTGCLSQQNLPPTYRYYDFLFNFVNTRLSPDRKEFFKTK